MWLGRPGKALGMAGQYAYVVFPQSETATALIRELAHMSAALEGLLRTGPAAKRTARLPLSRRVQIDVTVVVGSDCSSASVVLWQRLLVSQIGTRRQGTRALP